MYFFLIFLMQLMLKLIINRVEKKWASQARILMWNSLHIALVMTRSKHSLNTLYIIFDHQDLSRKGTLPCSGSFTCSGDARFEEKKKGAMLWLDQWGRRRLRLLENSYPNLEMRHGAFSLLNLNLWYNFITLISVSLQNYFDHFVSKY